MALVKKDIYNLAQSPKTTISKVGEEVRVDLSLEPNPNLNSGTITGTVTDTTGNPISGAVVKIMDNNYNPLAHVITGGDGSYIFSPFAPGNNYRVFASAPGYSLATTDPFSLLANQNIIQDIVATADPTLLKSFIAGDIVDDHGAPISGAVVELYSVDAENNELLIGLSFSNEYGQYVFRQVEKGNYAIRISALGYTSIRTTISITTDGSIAKVDSTLVPDPMASKGTISGIISDADGAAVVGADVILYKVETDNSLTPIALTKTIANGVYLFVNTPQGDYKVKSSKTVLQ
ncbi:MAG: carboxypeptidase-like regulatory domain-containing protein [Angelakisella sp.]